MRPGDRVLLQHTGSAAVPATLHMTWATVVELTAHGIIVRSDHEAHPRVVGLDDVRSWTRAAEPEA